MCHPASRMVGRSRRRRRRRRVARSSPARRVGSADAAIVAGASGARNMQLASTNPIPCLREARGGTGAGQGSIASDLGERARRCGGMPVSVTSRGCDWQDLAAAPSQPRDRACERARCAGPLSRACRSRGPRHRPQGHPPQRSSLRGSARPPGWRTPRTCRAARTWDRSPPCLERPARHALWSRWG